jgi:AcrR family transcriptional regulator
MPLPRSGPVRSEAARISILQATATLIAEGGYDRLTMEGIAARAGVGKQTIYRWWPSKGAVTAECLLEGMLLPGQLDIPNSGNVRNDLANWLATVFRYVETEQGGTIFRSLIAAAAENVDVGRRLRDALFRAQSVAARLRAGIGTSPNLSEGAPIEELAEALIGGVILRLLSREPVTPSDIDRMIDALLGR